MVATTPSTRRGPLLHLASTLRNSLCINLLATEGCELRPDDLEHQEDSSVNNAAELFLAKEFKLPYYYGPERVARLASLNIQQFLGLGAEVFEEATACELLRKITALPAERQHALMKAMAKQLWDEIPRKVRHGRELRQFLESVGEFGIGTHMGHCAQ